MYPSPGELTTGPSTAIGFLLIPTLSSRSHTAPSQQSQKEGSQSQPFGLCGHLSTTTSGWSEFWTVSSQQLSLHRFPKYLLCTEHSAPSPRHPGTNTDLPFLSSPFRPCQVPSSSPCDSRIEPFSAWLLQSSASPMYFTKMGLGERSQGKVKLKNHQVTLGSLPWSDLSALLLLPPITSPCPVDAM